MTLRDDLHGQLVAITGSTAAADDGIDDIMAVVTAHLDTLIGQPDGDRTIAPSLRNTLEYRRINAARRRRAAQQQTITGATFQPTMSVVIDPPKPGPERDRMVEEALALSRRPARSSCRR